MGRRDQETVIGRSVSVSFEGEGSAALTGVIEAVIELSDDAMWLIQIDGDDRLLLRARGIGPTLSTLRDAGRSMDVGGAAVTGEASDLGRLLPTLRFDRVGVVTLQG